MLELAVLGLLQEKASYGYELRKELHRKLGHFWQVSMGSLYPTLDRLEQRGAIEVLSGDDRPSRRSRKVYRITPAGEALFQELIEDRASTQWEDDKFDLRVAFFELVRPEIRLRLLERRRAYLADKLEDLRGSLDEATEHADSYTLSLMRHGMDATARDIAWLDELINAERRQLAADDDEPAAAPEATATSGGEAAPEDAPTTPGGRTPVRSRP